MFQKLLIPAAFYIFATVSATTDVKDTPACENTDIIPQITFPKEDFSLTVLNYDSAASLNREEFKTTVLHQYNVSSEQQIATKATFIIDLESGEEDL